MTTIQDTGNPPTSSRTTRALVHEGLAASGLLPTYERMVELDELLRAELDRLLPMVQAQANSLNHGTTEWYGRQRVLDEARHALAGGLGPGLRSVALQVHRLALHCQWLAGYAEES